MLSSCWHRSVHAFTWAAASFFAQSANALPLQCTLSADPAMVAAGASSTLTATCSPAATSFQWNGGPCSDPTSSTCTVTPSVTTRYSVIGSSPSADPSPAASTYVYTKGPYDGIYLWNDPGYYLSVHEIGDDRLIGSIYWVYSSAEHSANPVQGADADTFDLLGGKMVGSVVTMTGTRFYGSCALSYGFTFKSDSSLAVILNSADNSPGVSLADVDCAARYKSEGFPRAIQKISP